MIREKIAIIDKAPSRNNYSKYFDFDYDHFHMSSVPVAKLLKKDVDLVVDLDEYDLVILVGAEASKEYAGVTSVTNMSGVLVDDKYVCISNPAMLVFKPEGKPDFERSVDRIIKYVNGDLGMAKATGDFKGILNEDEAIEYFYEVLESDAPFIALDTETTALYPRDGYVLGLSMSYKKKQGRYIITDILSADALSILQRIIDKYEIVFHNLKFDYKMLSYHLGLTFNRARLHDTMIEHYLLDENDSHGLKDLALKYTDYGNYDQDLDDYKSDYCRKYGILKEDFTYDLIPFEVMWPYAAMDTGVTWELHEKFKPIIEKNPKLNSVYTNIMMPGILFLMDMEEVGIPIHKERAEAASLYLEAEIQEAKAKIYTFEEVRLYEKDSGSIFNPGSVIQLRKVLFDYVKLTPTGKLTKTGAISTDAEVLEELSEQHPLPAAILHMRKLAKIQSSYITKILPELDIDGRIRTNFNLTFTTSGRLSSSGKFNAQQIPRDDPIIKGLLVAPPGYKIVSQDLTTAEMYYAAVLSGDKELMKVFTGGGDFHSSIAKMVFNLPCDVEEVKKRFPGKRQSAKAISFGIN